MGFGSFNDNLKVTWPYAHVAVARPGRTCNIPECEPNYASRHQIRLTDSITFYNVCIVHVAIAYSYV